MGNLRIAIAFFLLGLLAFANGANDVSKGIATLAGSGVTETRKAISWGTVWTVAGSMAGIFFGLQLVNTFSKGIYVGDPSLSVEFALAIALAPSLWVILATGCGWPVSTTHAITGALLGTGVIAFGWEGVAWKGALGKIALPLLLSPLISILFALLMSPLLRLAMAKVENHCLCLTPFPKIIPVTELSFCYENDRDPLLPVLGTNEECSAAPVRWSLKKDQLHWLTSGLVSFARGLNDTPKVIAVILPLFVLSSGSSQVWLFGLAATAMGLGSWFKGRKVTEVLGFQVTHMDHDQGFSANLVTALIVLIASHFGFPVSTTHVSSSAIMGVGIAGGSGIDKKKVVEMVLAWIVTVPASAAIGIVILSLVRGIS